MICSAARGTCKETVVFLHVINKSIQQPNEVWLGVTLGEAEEPLASAESYPALKLFCREQEVECCHCGHGVEFSCSVTDRQRMSWLYACYQEIAFKDMFSHLEGGLRIGF